MRRPNRRLQIARHASGGAEAVVGAVEIGQAVGHKDDRQQHHPAAIAHSFSPMPRLCSGGLRAGNHVPISPGKQGAKAPKSGLIWAFKARGLQTFASFSENLGNFLASASFSADGMISGEIRGRGVGKAAGSFGIGAVRVCQAVLVHVGQMFPPAFACGKMGRDRLSGC